MSRVMSIKRGRCDEITNVIGFCIFWCSSNGGLTFRERSNFIFNKKPLALTIMTWRSIVRDIVECRTATIIFDVRGDVTICMVMNYFATELRNRHSKNGDFVDPQFPAVVIL